jgi:hypothetical protein
MKMEFGSKEWFKKVETSLKFPSIMAFYVSNKSKSVNSAVVNSEAENVGNIKYSKISPYVTLDNGEKIALLEVRRVHSAKQYYETAKRLREDWS